MTTSQRYDNVLWLCDVALSFIIIFPLCVLHWRGTWELENRLIPCDNKLLLWCSFIVLGLMSVCACLAQVFLVSHYPSSQAELLAPSSRSKLARKVCSRFYLYVFHWIYSSYWRNIWCLLDLYVGDTLCILLPAYAIVQTVRYVTNTTRWCLYSPLLLQRDSSDTVAITVFHSQVSHVLINFLLKNFI